VCDLGYDSADNRGVGQDAVLLFWDSNGMSKSKAS